MSVMDYVNKFNHLSQYAGTHIDIDVSVQKVINT